MVKKTMKDTYDRFVIKLERPCFYAAKDLKVENASARLNFALHMTGLRGKKLYMQYMFAAICSEN